MSDPTATPAIFGALVAIQSEMGKVEKSGRGPSTQGAYPFMPVDVIVERLGGLLTEHRVAVVPRQVSCEQQVFRFPKVNLDGQPIQDGRPDAVQIITRLQYDFTFLSAEDGSSITASSFGESIDTGDKGIRRAATAAYKEVLLRTFTVVAGEDDPDALDPNEQPAQVVKQNRGEQQRERAAKGPGERAPRAPRTPRAKPEESAAPATPAEAATPAEQPTEAPAAEAPAAPEPTREEKTPAEQRSDDWKPDPEDVAHAEANAPKAREAAAPVAPAEPTTQADKRYASVADARKAIREAVAERGLDRDYANSLGDTITKKPRGAWFSNLNDLHTVLKAIENGEAGAPEDEAGF
jgi:hypothetical protein